MAFTPVSNVRPFGIKDCRITPNAGVLTDVPLIQQLEVNIELEEAELTGDDKIAARRYYNPTVSGTIRAGGAHPVIIGIMTGGAPASIGAAGTLKNTVPVKGASRPIYCKIEAQSDVDESPTADFHIVIWNARFTNPSFTMEEGTFMITEGEFGGVPDASDNLVDFVWNTTAAVIT
jgi:hypothetical protein